MTQNVRVVVESHRWHREAGILTRMRTAVFMATLLAVTGCGGVQSSPVAPTPPPVALPEPTPPPSPPPGPHFALEIVPLNQATYDGDPWVGTVSVIMSRTIISPEKPARVVTTCGNLVQTHALGSGSVRVSCLLPVGLHSIEAVAEMGDGRSYPTAITVTVLPTPVTIVTVPLYYDVVLSSHEWTDVAFGTQTFTGAEYRWDFGDGTTAATLLNGADHRYTRPTKERTASVRIVKDGRTLATGSVIGRW